VIAFYPYLLFPVFLHPGVSAKHDIEIEPQNIPDEILGAVVFIEQCIQASHR
jgi:hypothetical protein